MNDRQRMRRTLGMSLPKTLRDKACSSRVARALGAFLIVTTTACFGTGAYGQGGGATKDSNYAYERQRMVELQLVSRGIRDERVLQAMRVVRRHRYAPDLDPVEAYRDWAHPIGHDQTISQPYVVALMSEAAHLSPPCKVLEVGTGSGYQAAVLAEMGCSVYSIEIVEPLARQASEILAAEGYGERVHVRAGDGYRGWPDEAPFDAILVTAAAPRVPEPLLEQLREGGRLVIPVGKERQTLEVVLRTREGYEQTQLSGVRFVPMTGEIRGDR
jgi:protein-L-isoaspartate(D-aspartate) O-methyltransferase